MRTARNSSDHRGRGLHTPWEQTPWSRHPPKQAPPGAGTPLEQAPPWSSPSRAVPSGAGTPSGVGLETPPGQIPLNFPLGCGPGDPPGQIPLNFTPGCGPGNLQGMLGYDPLLETCCKACWDTVTGPLRLWMFEGPGELWLNHSNVNFKYVY